MTTTVHERWPASTHRVSRRVDWALALVVAVAALPRLVLIAVYSPRPANDTPAYLTLASAFRHLDFSAYRGERLPGYPLLLALTGQNTVAVRVVQAGLGVATAALLYGLVSRITGRRSVALMVGLAFAVTANVMAFESLLLTESLSTFLVVLSLVLYWKPRLSTNRLVGLAAVCGLAAITRPALAVLPLLYAVHAVIMHRSSRRLGALVVAIGLAPIVLWSMFNAAHLGYFGPTTLTGGNLTTHSGSFIDDAPPEYAVIRDIYQRYEVRSNGGRYQRYCGNNSQTITRAAPEIMQRTGLTLPQLSRRLQAMSITMFVHHPDKYARSVACSLAASWNPEGGFQYPRFEDNASRRGFRALWVAEHWALVLVNVAFFAVVAREVLRWIRRKRSTHGELLAFLIVFVLVNSALNALTNVGSGRMGLPFEPFVLVVVALAVLGRRMSEGPVEHAT
jgi:hypothetical protein